MRHEGFARNFSSTLTELRTRGHDVTVLLDRRPTASSSGEPSPLDEILECHPGIDVGVRSTHPRRARFARGVRLWLDYLHYLQPGLEEARTARERVRRGLPRAVSALSDLPGARHALRLLLRRLERALPARSATQALRAVGPDVLLVTPLVDLGGEQVDLVRAARAIGVPSVLAVASWDNLTSKGTLHEVPDRVLVWNRRQRSELADLHGVDPQRVRVTGAAAYDHWFTMTAQATRPELCAEVALDPDRPYILYAGSSPFIAPDESAFVRRWLDGLRAHPSLADTQILIRPHPLNPIDVSAPGVATHPPGGANPVVSTRRQEYFDALYHSTAVVGVNTSALLEAALIGRPVLVIPAPQYSATQQGLVHFRQMMHDAAGALSLARTTSDHLSDVAATLGPHPPQPPTRAFVEAVVRPGGEHRSAAAAIVGALEEIVR